MRSSQPGVTGGTMPGLPIGHDYNLHIKTASDPAFSPDGTSVAYTLRQFDPDTGKELASVQELNLTSAESRLLAEDAEMPKWAPDGAAVGFLRRDARDKRQLWTLKPGAADSEKQITSHALGVDTFAWAPDSSRIAYRADVDDSAPPPDHDHEAFPVPVIARRIRYRQDGYGWRGDAFRHLFVVDVENGLTIPITHGDADDGPPVWSPDGDRIAFISDRSPFRDTTSRTEVYVVPAAGGEPDRWSGGLYMVGSIAWSPDGQRIAVTGAEQPEHVGGYGLVCQGWLYVLEPGSYPARLTDDSLRPQAAADGHAVSSAQPPIHWAEDNHVYFAADSMGQSHIASVSADGGEVKRITAGGEQITGWSVSSSTGAAVTAATKPGSVGELFLIDLASGEEKRLTTLNDTYLTDHPPATMEKFTIQRDGMDVECRLWLPPDFDSTERYPLLLDVHGGPHSVFYDAFYPIHQVGATNGYVVLAPNPRGSASYGLDFARAVHGDWGGGDYLDVMAAVTEAVKRPYIDESRVVIHGSSYGGYMASWAVGHSERFKAAVIAAPVTNLPSFYGTSDIGVNFSEVQFGGRRSDNLSWYIRHSPLSYASNVNTPVLLLHGEDDARVPIEQSEQYFVALKRAGKTVEFVRLPATSHGIFRAKHPRIREHYFRQMLDWFERHLNESPSTVTNGRTNGHRRGGADR